MENNTNQHRDMTSMLNAIRLEATSYIDKRMQWFAVSYQIRAATFLSAAIYYLILTAVIFIILFFTLIGLALLIGKLMGDPLAGFAILSLLAIIVLVIMIYFRKNIRTYFLNRAAVFLSRMEEDEEPHTTVSKTEDEK